MLQWRFFGITCLQFAHFPHLRHRLPVACLQLYTPLRTLINIIFFNIFLGLYKQNRKNSQGGYRTLSLNPKCSVLPLMLQAQPISSPTQKPHAFLKGPSELEIIGGPHNFAADKNTCRMKTSTLGGLVLSGKALNPKP